MVYTLTLNPALDYLIHVDDFQEGALNRVSRAELQFGGKGINVSTVLRNLDVPSVALGFIGGFTGTALEQTLREQGIHTDFVHLDEGLTRINVKLRANQETELNAPGPVISPKAINRLFQKLEQLNASDILVLAGSIPPSLPDTIYHEILSTLYNRNILSVVDTSGKVLRSVLAHRPFLIKPNINELSELAGRKLTCDQDIADCAAELQAAGSRNVLVSMAGNGSMLLDETGKLRRIPAHHGVVRNSVGAGDSMVAGFLAGWLKTGDYTVAHHLASAAGSATAFADGLASREQIFAIYSQDADPFK